MTGVGNKNTMRYRHFPRIFSSAARQRKVLMKIAPFCRLTLAAGGISKLSLEIC
jgi:hypothetical protein